MTNVDLSPDGRLSIRGNNNNNNGGLALLRDKSGGDGSTWIIVGVCCCCLLSSLSLAYGYYNNSFGIADTVDGLFADSTLEEPEPLPQEDQDMATSNDDYDSTPGPQAAAGGRARASRKNNNSNKKKVAAKSATKKKVALKPKNTAGKAVAASGGLKAVPAVAKPAPKAKGIVRTARGGGPSKPQPVVKK